MRLGLAFICGRETAQIKEMLDSVKAVKFDCVSAVMTKDSPATEKIIRKYGCRITKLKEFWNEDYSNWDFAAARQNSYDKCDADWIIYLDTDDVLTNANSLRPLIEECGDFDAIMLPYDYEPNNVYLKERVIKKGKYRWVGLVHEALMPAGEVKWITSDKVVVTHKMVSNDRDKRNLSIIEREYNSPLKTSRTVFYCGKDSMFLNLKDKAVAYFKEYLDTDSMPAEKHTACMYLFKMTGDVEYCHKAIDLLPDYAEPYFRLAKSYFDRGDYNACIEYSNIGFMKKCEAPFGMPHNRLDFTVYPRQVLDAAINKKEGKMDVSGLSLAELKSLWHDQMKVMQNVQRNIQLLDVEIERKSGTQVRQESK